MEDEKKEPITEIPSTTETSSTSPITKAPTIAIESSSPMLTTEALRELLKVLDQPEATTQVPETISVVQTTATAEITTQEPTTTSQSTTKAAEESTAESPREETQASTFEPLPTIEIVTQTAPTDSTTSQQQSSATEATYFNNVFPTAFDKLLTTLKEFLVEAEAAKSSEAPNPTTTSSTPQLEQKVEFVNFTVSEEHDESKRVVKRSVEAADLIPLHYKQKSLLIKEKGCVFNDRHFKVGEVIKTDNSCLKCLCEYAPIGHCVRKEKCNL